MEVSANHIKAANYLKRLSSLTHDELCDALTYKWFRLNTLYHIKDKDGKKVLFVPNKEQETYYIQSHNRDLILKVRQLGFTTFKMIENLDDCLFTINYSAGCICHNFDSAKDIFRNKIKFAYQAITDEQRAIFGELGYDLPVPVNDKDNTYVFNNGSSIQVSTGYRGGTLQSLHVSEFGKICKQSTEKAKEIVTGAFEAVGAEGDITIESTAEGRSGYFYEYATKSKKNKIAGKKLSTLDFKFHFFSWWDREEYAIDGGINPDLESYFDELEVGFGIVLNDRQKAWYSVKAETLGDEVKREYPSTPEEAFEASEDGVVIKSAWINAAVDAHIKLGFEPAGTKRLGYDVADSGNDANAVCGAHGSVVDYLHEWQSGEDEMQKSCRKVWRYAKENKYEITYDSIGVGAGCGSNFKEENSKFKYTHEKVVYSGFNAGSGVATPERIYADKKKHKDMFSNAKAQAWWQVADRFKNTYDAINNGTVYETDELISISSTIDHLEQLKLELSTPLRDEDNNGRMKVESKRDLKKRDVESPNLADAFVMCFTKKQTGVISAFIR